MSTTDDQAFRAAQLGHAHARYLAKEERVVGLAIHAATLQMVLVGAVVFTNQQFRADFAWPLALGAAVYGLMVYSLVLSRAHSFLGAKAWLIECERLARETHNVPPGAGLYYNDSNGSPSTGLTIILAALALFNSAIPVIVLWAFSDAPGALSLGLLGGITGGLLLIHGAATALAARSVTSPSV